MPLGTKLLARLISHGVWLPRDLNWWIGVVFAIGAALFSIASILSLLDIAVDAVNVIYFLGSIPFTFAAYLQLYQAANADPLPSNGKVVGNYRSYLGWKPRDIGWLSCAFQFVGTVLFNINTFDAMLPLLSWFEQDLLVWIPNIVGSILFLVSGYLAFIEVGHAYWAWKPRDLSWWITFTNFLGCVGFMISAVLAIGLPVPASPLRITLSVAFTLQGAICFCLGALLMLPEASHVSD
ncbi:hypothetical protein [Bremerella alba]|uniref:hypothetical protein n=1 Tax=Bremerella alba TaxID=980252 RepID=UPI0028F42A0F|nr:hypothetical protein [Bremerella alba]